MLVSTASVTVLISLVLLLCAVTRFKGESTFAALVILLTTIPDYIYTLARINNLIDVSIIFEPLAQSSNLALMPLMYILAHKGFNPYYRFRAVHLLHFIPTAVFAVLVALNLSELPLHELNTYTIEKSVETGRKLTALNFTFLSIQLAAYITVIFGYLRKVKKYIFSHYSAAEMQNKTWIPRLITLIGVMLIISMVSYNVWEQISFYIFYFANVIAMGYIIFNQFEEAYKAKNNMLPSVKEVEESIIEFKEENTNIPNDLQDLPLLKQYAQTVEQWLEETQSYTNPNLSLKEVSKGTGISSNNISKSINTVLDKNFFDLINGHRIEKSKELLLNKKELGLTLETIAEQCGFNSQHTYCRAFKQQTGLTTGQWIKTLN